MRRYLQTRRALGRDYQSEEAILLRWDAFLVRRYGNAREVKPPMFQLWVQAMTTLTAIVQRQRMRIVRNFLLFHARQAPDTYIPDLKTFPKPSPLRSPRLVSVAEMAQLLAAAEGYLPPTVTRCVPQTVRLALVLLFCCGLRRGELFRLKIQHFDPREKVLRVEATKFHKSRLVPLSDSVAEEVQRYLALRRSPLQPDAPLLSSNQCRGHETTYSAHALTENWQLLCLTAGVLNERGRPPRLHDLRHSFAVAALDRWYRQGIDVQSKLPHLATYLGHVSVASTHYYLQLSPELGQSASQRFHHYASQILTREISLEKTGPIVTGFGIAGLPHRLSPTATGVESSHPAQLPGQPQAALAVRGGEKGRSQSTDDGALDIRAGHGFLCCIWRRGGTTRSARGTCG